MNPRNVIGPAHPAHPAHERTRPWVAVLAGPRPQPVCDCEGHRLGFVVLDTTTGALHDRAVHPTRAAAQRFATRGGLVVAAIAWKEEAP